MVSAAKLHVDPIDVGEEVAQNRKWQQAHVDFTHGGLFERRIHGRSSQIVVASGLCAGWRLVSDYSYAVSNGYALVRWTLANMAVHG